MATIESLLDIMQALRDPAHGCPWDLQQTFASIAPYTLEEAYEVVDAIERNDPGQLRDELGDLLFQVVFHSQMASEEKLFDFADVVSGINDKMRRRHPHVFADKNFDTPAEVVQSWHSIKQRERGDRGSVLDGIPVHLPALKKAQKIGSAAAALGFDWPGWHGALDKLHEEIDELEQAIQMAQTGKAENVAKHADGTNISSNHGASDALEQIGQELGDVLFSVVNICRHFGIDAESALNGSSRKFTRRFESVERGIKAREKIGEVADANYLEKCWEDAKSQE